MRHFSEQDSCQCDSFLGAGSAQEVSSREQEISATVIYPTDLTPAQEGLWSGQMLDAQNPIYNTGEYIEIKGELDLTRFSFAVNQVMAESDVLALQIEQTAKGPMQRVCEDRRAVLEIVDLRNESDPVAAAKKAMDEDMSIPCDLENTPLVRQCLFRLGDAHYYWYERIHHVLIDAWGQSLINTRVAALYRGDDQAGETLTPYTRWLEDVKAYSCSSQQRADAAYWHAQFGDNPPVVADLSLGKGGVAITAHDALRLEQKLPQDLEDVLQLLCEKESLVWPDVLTALCAAYISRHASANETVIGVPYMGRMGQVCARIPATVMNVLPLRVVVDEQKPLTDFFVSVSKTLRLARRHGRYRSEQLRRDLGLLGGQKRLYGPSVNILPFDCAQLDLPGVETIRHPLGNGPVEDMTFTFRADACGRGLRLEIHANPKRYCLEDVQLHLQRLSVFLLHALQADVLCHVPTLTDEESWQWVHGSNQTSHLVPQTTLVHLMQTAWQQHAQAIAVEYEGQQLSYAQLEGMTQQIALSLYQAGVRKGDRVAVLMPRSLELVLTLVAVLRVGAAYLPLDIDSPKERLETIVASAQPKVICWTEAVKGKLSSLVNVPALLVDAGSLDFGYLCPNEQVALSILDACVPDPYDAAYIIYTSGSTGTPKGVVIEHDAIVNRLLWMQQHYGITSDERILQKTPVTFDVSVWEFFLPLISGATLVVAPPDAHKDPLALAKLMREARITTLHFVPSMLSIFLTQHRLFSQAGELSHLRRVFCSGEALPVELRELFHATIGGVGGAQLHNLYGPTEAAVDVSYWDASYQDVSSPVPIGFPVWNTQLYVLDENLHPVPPGVVGNLYLGGRQLARGYLGRDDLTAERFIANPFRSGERMYATGDLARWRDDGAVVFLGRSDFQIKIRGQRVELEEIEATLATVSGVAQVAVIVRVDQPGDQRIVAYIVAQQGADLSVERVREKAVACLPDYMVPSAVMLLEHLPVTSNGKLDRRALPEPAWTDEARKNASLPSSTTEQAVAGLFAKILGIHGQVYADDDFFNLGGHSLLAAQLMLDIRTQWGYAIGLGALFEHPSVAQLAAYIDQLEATQQESGHEGFSPILYLQKNDDSKRPALFCVHPAGGLCWCYSNLARALQTKRPVIGLQSTIFEEPGTFPKTLQSMAEQYVERLLSLQPHGPYHLLGWSVGGIIAHTMAVVLQQRGANVGALALLDAYPCDCWRQEHEPAADVALKALLHIAGYDPQKLKQVEMTRESVIAFLRQSNHPLGFLSDSRLEDIMSVVAGNNRLVQAHEHQLYDGKALHFCAALDHQGKNIYPQQWQPYVSSIEVYDIPAFHGELVSARCVAKIFPVLDTALSAYELEKSRI